MTRLACIVRESADSAGASRWESRSSSTVTAALVFPSNFLADLDFSAIETEEQLSAVVRRDFEAKAPTGTDILAKTESGGYASRFELLRDLALNLFWANRYAMTMYEKRPTRWRDVPALAATTSSCRS